MKDKKILFLLIIIIFIFNFKITKSIDNHTKDFSTLFQGVNRLTFTGVPGLLKIEKPAIPLVISSEKSNPKYETVISGTKFENGIVFAFSHCNFLSDDNFDYFDNKTFVSNILKLNKKNRVVISEYHGESINRINLNKFSNFLKGNNYEVSYLNKEINQEDLSNCCLLIIGFPNKNFSEDEILTIIEYVKNGGILFIFGIGWVWASYFSDKTFEEFPCNIIGSYFGIKWIDGYLVESKENIYSDATIFTTFYPDTLKYIKENYFEDYQWIDLNKGINCNSFFTSVVVNPKNPDIIYFTSWCGIFKSIDGGKNWYKINTGLKNLYVESIIIDPKNPKILYAATRGGGIFKSKDEGKTWYEINNGIKNLNIITLTIDPIDSNILYAGTFRSYYVFKSVNGGDSWVTVYEYKEETGYGVSSIAIDPNNNQIIYLVTADAVSKSIDGGKSWKKLVINFYNPYENVYTRSGCEIIIDSNNTQILYVTTLIGIFKSVDGGLNWRCINQGLKDTWVLSIIIDPKNSNVLYACTYGGEIFSGVYKTIDGGENWFEVNKGLDAKKFVRLAIDPINTNIVYALSDGYGLFKYTYNKMFKINSFVGEGGTISPSGEVFVNQGSYQNYIITPFEGYNLKYIFVDGVLVNNNEVYTFSNINDNHTIIAIFEKIAFTITTKAGEGGKIEPQGTIKVKFKNSQTFNFIPDKGYRIKDVIIDGKSIGAVDKYSFENINEDHRIEVLFEKLKFTITAIAHEGGTINPSGIIEVEYGSSYTFYIIPESGYRIKDILFNGKSVGPSNRFDFTEVTNNHTIEAFFEKCKFQIESKAGIGGKIEPSDKVDAEYGDSYTFYITPDPEYRIKDVIIDGKSVGSVSSYKFLNITSNHTIEVTFEKRIIIILQIGNKVMYVNDTSIEIDVPAQIIEGRTYLPIRWITEPLGAEISWDSSEKKVTILFKEIIIELWVGRNIAKINGNNKFIDPDNSKVVPLIIQGRTMLPIRFVAENLGCSIDWDQDTKTVTITYPKD